MITILPLIAGGLAIFLAAGAGAQEKPEPIEPIRESLVRQLRKHIEKVDASAAELKAPDFPAGKEWFNAPPLSLERELKGKIVVLDFWTYCCINCIHVLPDLAALEEKYAAFPVAFVGVHSAKFDNEKLSENIRQAVLRYEIRHPVINDDEMSMWRGIGVRSWPTLAVIGPRGNLLLMVAGEGNKEVLDASITAALEFYPPEAFRHEPVPKALERDRRRIESPLRFPGKLAIDPVKARLFISDSNHNRIVVADLQGKFLEAIGSGRAGIKDGGYGEAAFNRLQGLAWADPFLYVADAENHALRRVDTLEKTVITLAGSGEQGRDYSGGKKGAEQLLSTPWDVAVRGDQVFIAMAGTHQIWVHDVPSGATSAYSGSGSELNYNSAERLEAGWAQPSGLTIGAGQLFVADSESSSVRSIELEIGATRTIAGGDDANPRNLFAFGDRDGSGGQARLQHPLGVLWLNEKGRVLVADTYNHRLKMLDPQKGSIATWAGSGKAGLEDGTGLAARFSEPSGMALGPDGRTVFVADANNHAIRLIDLETAAVRTLELKDVPPPLPPSPPRQKRIADLPEAPTIRAAALRLTPGAEGRLKLRLHLPGGHHYSEGAGSRWQVLDEDGSPIAIEERRASGQLDGAAEIVIPFTAAKEKASGLTRLEALAYFCKGDESCQVGAVIFEIPITVGEPGDGSATEATLEHTFTNTLEDPSPRAPQPLQRKG